MTSGPTIHRTPIRRRRVVALLVLVVVAAALGDQVLATSSPRAPGPVREHRPPGAAHARPLGEADGAVPAGTTVFDDEVPGVARLSPALLAALRRAASDAGIAVRVDSGWRSAAYQRHLLEEAIAKYGSEHEASRWVAPPDRSAHVSGDAVDVGPEGAAAWLSRHGAAYGLCPVYANEPWHFELRPDAAARGCPPLYPDPTNDPRLHR